MVLKDFVDELPNRQSSATDQKLDGKAMDGTLVIQCHRSEFTLNRNEAKLPSCGLRRQCSMTPRFRLNRTLESRGAKGAATDTKMRATGAVSKPSREPALVRHSRDPSVVAAFASVPPAWTDRILALTSAQGGDRSAHAKP